MAGHDKAYTNLLAHLHDSSPALPLSTIQSALAHYLANLSLPPTSLAATALSSTLFTAQPFTHEKLHSLLTAFRHAAHLKYRALTEDFKSYSPIRNLFTKSLNAALGQWLDDVAKGIQGGHPILRLTSLSGLVLGIHDLELDAKNTLKRNLRIGSSRNDVEDELIVATAEVIDSYSSAFMSGSAGNWEEEFRPSSRDTLSLALIIASQSLPLVSQARFNALPLPTLAHLVVRTLSSAFQYGKFLHELPSSVNQQGEHHCSISPSSPVAKALHSITSSTITASTASLSRLAANSLRSTLESYSNSRITDGLRSASQTLQILRDMAVQIEQDWSSGPLADVPEDDITPETRPVTQAIWTTLKTMLFSTIMLSDAILTTVAYIKPGSAPYTQAAVTHSELALQVLNTLSCYSFIISQFGGVTSTSQGFEQLKKTFYLALDILAEAGDGNQTSSLANSYVESQCLFLKSSALIRAPRSIRNAKIALVLASIEQLVPVLNEECIREYVFDICWPHLSDPSHRETFESAHSVILAIFASHAQQQQQRQATFLADADTRTATSTGVTPAIPNHAPRVQPLGDFDFVTKMVPFYAHCLIENSADGRLSTPQLRMAYSALVRCAGASGLNVDTVPEETLGLAWYCIQLLLNSIGVEDALDPGKVKEKQIAHHPHPHPLGSDGTVRDQERLHRLRLTLISAVPSLPLVLMLQVLEQIKAIIISTPLPTHSSPISSDTQAQRNELVKALFDEIMEHVGYREKSAAMKWWYENRMVLQYGSEVSAGEEKNEDIEVTSSPLSS